MLAIKEKSLAEIFEEFVLERDIDLPVFPSIITGLQKLLEDENAPIDKIAQLIYRDQALAANILQMANSPYFSALKKIETIRDAIIRLGSDQVVNLCISAQQQTLHKSKNPKIDMYLKKLWYHAIGVAAGARWLARKIHYGHLAEVAFLAGLMHDVGRLHLLRVMEELINDGHPITETVLDETLWALHCKHGYTLAKKWNLPDVYAEVILHHNEMLYQSPIPEYNLILKIVQTTDAVCQKMGLQCTTSSIPFSARSATDIGITELVVAELEVYIDDSGLCNPKPAVR